MNKQPYIKQLLSEVRPFNNCKVNTGQLKNETICALAGAILVIPQAISFAYLAGLPAEYGLYSAIFVTFIAAMFGSTSMSGGPNTASAMLIAVTVLPLAGRGSALFIEYVLLLTMMVGLVQLFIWFCRGGKYFQYFSPIAISAISTGVGCLIMMSALDGMLAINTSHIKIIYQRIYLQFSSVPELINAYSLVLACVTLVSGFLLKKQLPRTYILLAVLIGYLSGLILHQMVPQMVTQVELIGNLPYELLPFQLPNLNVSMVFELLDSAVIIALIGLSQSMVIVKEIKIQNKQIVNDEKEVLAQAMSNVLGSFLSCFAGAGSFNRTNVALNMKAATPISAMLSSVFVILLISLLQPVLILMPIPMLSGILFLVGAGMIKFKKLRKSLATLENKILFWITLLTVLFVGLKVGIAMAIFLSIVNFLLHANQLEITDNQQGDYRAITIHGNFFYASIDQLMPYFENKKLDVILNLDFVAYFDDFAAEFIYQEIKLFTSEDKCLLLVAPSSRHGHCLQRHKEIDLANIFESYAKARTALEVISVSRFLSQQKKQTEIELE